MSPKERQKALRRVQRRLRRLETLARRPFAEPVELAEVMEAAGCQERRAYVLFRRVRGRRSGLRDGQGQALTAAPWRPGGPSEKQKQVIVAACQALRRAKGEQLLEKRGWTGHLKGKLPGVNIREVRELVRQLKFPGSDSTLRRLLRESGLAVAASRKVDIDFIAAVHKQHKVKWQSLLED